MEIWNNLQMSDLWSTKVQTSKKASNILGSILESWVHLEKFLKKRKKKVHLENGANLYFCLTGMT